MKRASSPTPVRKLRLDPDLLRVETFRTDEVSAQAGTVLGFATEQRNTNCCGSDPPPVSSISCLYGCGVTFGIACGVSEDCTSVASCVGCTHEN